LSAAAKRVRRTPQEARRVILEAAESVIARTGPGGLRAWLGKWIEAVSGPRVERW